VIELVGTVKLSRILGFWRRNRSALERRINNLESGQVAELALKSVNLTVPLTPLPGTVDFQMTRKDRKVLKLKDVNYDYWLDPDHPRILYHDPLLKEEEILDGIERAWRDFYGMASTIKRCRRFGMFRDVRDFLAYFVVCQGMRSRYRRYGISADSAVKGTKHKIANILGKMALSLLKRPPQPGWTTNGTNGASRTPEAVEPAAGPGKDSPAMQPAAELPQISQSSVASQGTSERF